MKAHNRANPNHLNPRPTAAKAGGVRVRVLRLEYQERVAVVGHPGPVLEDRAHQVSAALYHAVFLFRVRVPALPAPDAFLFQDGVCLED